MTIDIVGLRSLADNLRPEYPVTMEELDKALDRLDRLDRLEAALQRTQWGGMDSWYQDEAHEACPECSGVDPTEWPDATVRKVNPQLGHEDDCSIGAAINGVQP